MELTIIAVGSLQQKYYREAADEYKKRLGSYFKVNEIEIKEERLPSEPSDSEIRRSLEKEADKILSAIPKRSYVTALCIEGSQMSSEEFSRMTQTQKVNGFSSFVFIIGSSHGMSDRVKNAADRKLSMSEMTFPHQLARVMLYEAIYRAEEISAGSRYHK